MKIPTSGITPFPGAAQPRPTRPAASVQQQSEDVARHFDQITIKKESGSSSFEAELKSRLTQEVCTATTTGTITALRRQIEAGEYRPDPAAIARKMLLFTEE